jgi:hypothetical protein
MMCVSCVDPDILWLVQTVTFSLSAYLVYTVQVISLSVSDNTQSSTGLIPAQWKMRIVLRRKLVVLPILLLTVLAWTGHHLSTSYSCAQARSAKVAKRNARAAQLRSLQADTSRLSVELEMLARSDHIQEVCRNYQLREDDNQDCGYRSKDQSFDQNIENHFLADPRTGTVYCFIHKVGFSLLFTCVLSFAMQVASSTWMSLFARLENNMKFLKQVEKDGNYYQVDEKILLDLQLKRAALYVTMLVGLPVGQ